METITVYNRKGTPLAELDASITYAWLLNSVGRGELTLSTADPKCTKDILAFSNWVVVQSDTLPPWVGMFDTPRSWEKGKVSCTVWEAGKVLRYRRGLATMRVTATAGKIFTAIIQEANRQGDTLIRMGEVYDGGDVLAEEIDLSQMLDEVIRIAEVSGQDWSITPVINPDNTLYLKANWYKKRGYLRDFNLLEGHNVVVDDYTEQGDIINDVMAFGEGASWDSKNASHVVDFSGDDVGLRQGTLSVNGAKVVSAIVSAAKAELAKSKRAENTFSLAAIDTAETYQNLALGDMYPIKIFSVGFTAGGFGVETVVRINGMTNESDSGTVNLTTQEVL